MFPKHDSMSFLVCFKFNGVKVIPPQKRTLEAKTVVYLPMLIIQQLQNFLHKYQELNNNNFFKTSMISLLPRKFVCCTIQAESMEQEADKTLLTCV